MIDSAAALVDQRLRPPRQGDGDDGRAVLLECAGTRQLGVIAGAWRRIVRQARVVAAGDGGRGRHDHQQPGRYRA